MRNKTQEKRNNAVAGAMLVVIGLIILGAQWLPFDMSPEMGVLILPAIALVLLVWGALSRDAGPLIPAGILAGIGLGSTLIVDPFNWNLFSAADEGAVFLISFSLGWFSIVAFTALFARKLMWWPAIPGVILGVIGAGLLFGGALFTAVEWVGKLWPLLLVGAGIYLIVKTRREATQQ